MDAPSGRRRRSALLAVAVAVLLTIAGSVLSWRLIGSHSVDTPLGTVSMEAAPSIRGEVDAFVPVANWGLRADALDAPVEFRAELRSLERDGVLRAAEGDRSVLDDSEARLRDGVRTTLVRALAWALVVTVVLLLLATAIWRSLRPRWLLVAVGVPMAALALASVALAANATFKPAAFASPTFYANGAELRRVLEVATEESVESQYGSTFANALRSISALLLDEPAQGAPARELYSASDFHANALVVAPLARLIGDAPLILAGDFGQRGGEAEARALAPRAAALGSRVIAVSGNHDTAGLMGALAAEGVTVLLEDGTLTPSGPGDDPVIDVDGLAVAGFPDPLTGEGSDEERPITFGDLEDPDAAFDDAVTNLAAWFEGLPERPDVVVVHQNDLAQELARSLEDDDSPLTILTGHDHDQHIDRYGDVVVVSGGTVGAGGLFGAGEEAVGFAELQFDPVEPILRSVNLLQVEPFSGEGQASRVVIDQMCPDEPRCSFEPTPLDVDPAGD
jgi:predicted phosphodiesterase